MGQDKGTVDLTYLALDTLARVEHEDQHTYVSKNRDR